jgi:hypothetical protein
MKVQARKFWFSPFATFVFRLSHDTMQAKGLLVVPGPGDGKFLGINYVCPQFFQATSYLLSTGVYTRTFSPFTSHLNIVFDKATH